MMNATPEYWWVIGGQRDPTGPNGICGFTPLFTWGANQQPTNQPLPNLRGHGTPVRYRWMICFMENPTEKMDDDWR